MLKKLLALFEDFIDFCLMIHWRRREIKKYKDPRRVSIFSQVELTDEQKSQIDELFIKNYGEKIPYTWHRHFTAFTGKFDVNYFPELLFIPEFERYMSIYIEYAKVFTDKNMLPMLAREAGVKTLDSCFTATRGAYRNKHNQFITFDEFLKGVENIGEVFIKPTCDTCSGQGCFVANFSNGIDSISGKTSKEIFLGLGRNFAVQRRLKCHESITRIYSGSVNTFRIITYRWREKILAFPSIMRIGSGGAYLDNAHAGGMFIAIDNDGTLHKTAFTEFKNEFTEHPDTHLKFEGYKIDLFPKAFDAAKRLHSCLPQVGCVNWDLTIDEHGEPVLIEANMNNGRQGGSVWLCEIAHGCGAFGDNTAEVLRWLRVMKKLPKSQWYKYEFGQLPKEGV